MSDPQSRTSTLLKPFHWIAQAFHWLAQPFHWLASKTRALFARLHLPGFIRKPLDALSMACDYLWRPSFFLAAALCVLAGFLRAFGLDRPSLFSIYAAGLLAGVGALTGLAALPTTDGIALDAEELI